MWEQSTEQFRVGQVGSQKAQKNNLNRGKQPVRKSSSEADGYWFLL